MRSPQSALGKIHQEQAEGESAEQGVGPDGFYRLPRHPQSRGSRCFDKMSLSTSEIQRLENIPSWPDKATKSVIQYWRIRNHGKPEAEFNKCHPDLAG
jgi:hypothetical protein